MTTITLPRAVVEQALEALSLALSDVNWRADSPTQPVIHKAHAALRAALAQEQDEPVLQTCNCRWDGEAQVQQCTLHEAHVEAIHEWAERAKVAERKLAQQAEPVAYTTGHCENHKQKGGCQLHNLQCGWPDCDRKPTTASSQQAEPVQDQRCRAEPRSDGDFVCDCKIGDCLGRSAALAQQAEPVQQVKTCAWRDNLDAIYETECGNLHIVSDGTLEENGMKYCCYCGKEIKDESPT